MGVTLKNPLILGASNLVSNLDKLKQAEEAGVAAVVYRSLFEEQIAHEEIALSQAQDFGTESFAESLSYFPEPAEYRAAPDIYLDTIAQAKKAVNMPIIGSLNGETLGGWVSFATQLEEAGASAIELDLPVGLTISIGGAIFPRDSETSKAILEKADQALDDIAKKFGRGTVKRGALVDPKEE